VKAIFGSIEIRVPADITVEVHGSGVFGNFEGAMRATADPDAPTLRIVGSAIFASVVVKTLPPLRVQKLVDQLRARRLLPP
jgi:predicted membrane protein